jgi:hypothetical protein
MTRHTLAARQNTRHDWRDRLRDVMGIASAFAR